jgi:hypothetical protein
MKESTEQLLKDLYDVIDALKSKRCEDEKFRERWCEKRRMVSEKIEMLDKVERDALDARYSKEFRERYSQDKERYSQDK